MLRMITDKGMGETHIYDEETKRLHSFSGGHSGLEEALYFVAVKVFHATTKGKKLGVSKKQKFPVRSLIPPTKTKVVKFFDLGEEIV